MTDDEGENPMTEATAPLRPGDSAPDITMPSATGDSTISLAEYRGRSPVLLALFRGLY